MKNEDLAHIWQKALEIFQSKLSKPSFQTWLKSTKLIAIEENNILVEVPNEFSKDWLETRYDNLIKETINQLINRNLDVKFVIPEPQKEESNNKINDKKEKKIKEKESQNKKNTSFLNPKYTFDTFVIGSSNRFAHAASLAEAEAPAKAYNPLFIYGDV
ncbi:MAG: chromosomal replication initiator protein, partial [Candidatus Frackibacter sp. T328-2]